MIEIIMLFIMTLGFFLIISDMFLHLFYWTSPVVGLVVMYLNKTADKAPQSSKRNDLPPDV